MRVIKIVISTISILSSGFLFGAEQGQKTAAALPEGFVYATGIIPNLKTDIRYASSDNFMGRPLAGYAAPKCVMTKQVAEALKAVQEELKPFNLGLKVYDAYRPARAVRDMIAWVKDPAQKGSKSSYFPRIPKDKLVDKGYISEQSAHSRGSAVDVTLVSLDYWGNDEEIDMGSRFDYFDPMSFYSQWRLSPEQKENRGLLRDVMKRHGFEPCEREWWHFQLKNEPYPNDYFDFIVR